MHSTGPHRATNLVAQPSYYPGRRYRAVACRTTRSVSVAWHPSGSVAEVVLGYPHAIARCTSSSLMPEAYGMRGGYRATFTGAVLEYTMRAGFAGQGPSTVTEHTADG